MDTIKKHFHYRKEKIISSMIKFSKNYGENQVFDDEFRKILSEQVSRRMNLSALETKVVFVNKPDFLNIRLTLFLDKQFSIKNLVESFTTNLFSPYSISLNAYYLCYTRERDLYLVHPTKNTSLDYGIIHGKNDYDVFLNKLGNNDAFIASLLSHHEDVLSIDGEGIFRRSGFSFMRMVALEAYVKCFDSSNFYMDY